MLAIDCSMKRKLAFATVLITLLLCGILRSAIATRLDSFDLDEAYHITAGVTYARLGDYRLNPEHPPLIKLWVGVFLTPDIFKTPQFRPLADKWEERSWRVVFRNPAQEDWANGPCRRFVSLPDDERNRQTSVD